MVIIAEIEYQPRLLRAALESTESMCIHGMDFDILDESIRVIQWAAEGDFAALERTLTEMSEVGEYSVLTSHDDRKLYSLVYDIPLEESVYYI